MTQIGLYKIIENQIFGTDPHFFQHFCDRLLLKKFPLDYTPTRSGGKNGDMKNDGYCHVSRTFFQAHASRGEKISAIKRKIKSDLEGCSKMQSNILQFIFITNSTHLGEIETYIDSLRTSYSFQIEVWGPKKSADLIIAEFPLNEIEYIIDIPIPVKDDVKYIKYDIDEKSIKRINSDEIKLKGKLFILACIMSLAAMFSSLYLITLIHPMLIAFLALPPMGFAVWYYTFFRLWLMASSKESDEYLLHIDRYVSKDAEGNCTLYTKKAPCVFENCKGIVELQKAPPRERNRFTIIGCCTRNPTTHTYTIDFDGSGYYERMNFTPIEPRQKK